jgi:hypothetical protein
MHRLMRERVAPPDDPLVACSQDTAAIVDPITGRVNTGKWVIEFAWIQYLNHKSSSTAAKSPRSPLSRVLRV